MQHTSVQQIDYNHRHRPLYEIKTPTISIAVSYI